MSGISTSTTGALAAIARQKMHLLCFETVDPALDMAIHNYIRDAAHIRTWWNYIPGIFIFDTDRPLHALQQDFYPFFAGRRFLIIEVNPLATGGWLPASAWQWLNTAGHSVQNALLALTQSRP